MIRFLFVALAIAGAFLLLHLEAERNRTIADGVTHVYFDDWSVRIKDKSVTVRDWAEITVDKN
jgi:hypothetical protein